VNGGKKKGGRWNWKENKEGDNVDQNIKKKKQQTKQTHKVKINWLSHHWQSSVQN
jgi:hypothetical protein